MNSKVGALKNYPLKKLTTMKVGGPAKYFASPKGEKELIKKVLWANENKIKWRVIGDGSNLIPSDSGFNGLIIKNEVEYFKRSGGRVLAGAGGNLLRFIFKLNASGLAGMEKMAGIPGTIGGAIYGSAGAYGQEIKDCLTRVKIFDGKKVRWLSKKEYRFGYRESVFKKNKNWVILAAEFKFQKANSKGLQKTSKGIIKLREKKYQPGLSCPGSFFKNIVVENIRPIAARKNFLSKIPKEKVMFGKVPAGYLLEATGAKGMRAGGIKVARHHGNLIYNSGKGKSSEVIKLSKILKQKVRKKFGITLDEEIQYI